MLFEKTTPIADFSQTSMLWYGWPKYGKSTLSSHLKSKDGREPLFIATEDGHKSLSVFRKMVTTWDGFLRLLTYLEKNVETLKKEHSCLIIDLISDLDNMLARYLEEQSNVAYIHDLEWGKGSQLIASNMSSAIQRLISLLPCIFLCHATDREIMWYGEKIKVQCPNLSKQTLLYINGKVDIIAWFGPSRDKELHAEFVVSNSPMCLAGSRYPQLKGSYPLYKNNPAKTIHEIVKAFEGGSK